MDTMWMRRGWAVAAAVVACAAVVARGSEAGQKAVDQVSESAYRYFLGDNQGIEGLLYTHDGDNRGVGGPEHDLARDNIAAMFQQYGLTVTLEPVQYSGNTYYNVVGTKTGSAHSTQEYVIGAHYDSVNNPGADDNASGVALVLEAARILTQYESAYTIRFIAFTREEQGLYGSEAYVDAHAMDDIVGMISADMVAYASSTNQARIYGRTSSPVKTHLGNAVTLYGDGLTWMDAGWISASDHDPFDSAGYDACLLIEYEVWSNPYYHEPEDSVDNPNNINYPYAVRMTRSVVGYLVDQAGVVVRPSGGDVNFDAMVNLDDYVVFTECMAGPDATPDPLSPVTVDDCLGAFDLNDDGDVDLDDFAAFTALFGTGDCNGNGVADQEEIWTADVQDCNHNSVPDECDIASGTSLDCNLDGIPDECEEDCNGNGVPDDCDVLSGTSEDCQPDGLPDECQLVIAVTAQNTCADAMNACPGVTYSGSTSGATVDGSASCGTSSTTKDVWYRYTPATSGSLTVSTCGSAYDTVLSVHTGCPGTTANQIVCNDDSCSRQSEVTLSVAPGTSYLIRVSGWNGNSGSFVLDLTGPDCAVPSNDCNGNAVPDECDIASGTSADLNGNDIPDECE